MMSWPPDTRIYSRKIPSLRIAHACPGARIARHVKEGIPVGNWFGSRSRNAGTRRTREAARSLRSFERVTPPVTRPSEPSRTERPNRDPRDSRFGLARACEGIWRARVRRVVFELRPQL